MLPKKHPMPIVPMTELKTAAEMRVFAESQRAKRESDDICHVMGGIESRVLRGYSQWSGYPLQSTIRKLLDAGYTVDNPSGFGRSVVRW